MNLADAIRTAQKLGGVAPATTQPVQAMVEAPKFEPMPEPVVPEDRVDATTASTLVRLELYLTPDQVATLFKTIAVSQHNVMTSREASHYVRATSHTLEELAEEGEIAAFKVDGKWRFPKTGLDEWVAKKALRKEAC